MKVFIRLVALAVVFSCAWAAATRKLEKKGVYRIVDKPNSEDNALEIEVTPTNGPCKSIVKV